MITKLSHATIYVLNYDQAIRFFVGKLGFTLTNDIQMDHGFRWVTVSAPSQPDVAIILYEPVLAGYMDQETVDHLRALLEKGVLGGGVLETDDCQRDYETLKAKGVEFVRGPQQTPYGLEAIMRDGCGNWYSLTQRPTT